MPAFLFRLDVVQGQGDVAGYFFQQGALLLVRRKFGGDRDDQKAIDRPVVLQSHGQRRPASVLIRQGTAGAGGWRIGDDVRARLRPRQAHTMRPVAVHQPFEQGGGIAVHPGGGGRQKLADVVYQGDPGVVIAASLDQIVASLLDQPVAVLFSHDELVDVADGAEDAVQALGSCLHLCLLLLGADALGDVCGNADDADQVSCVIVDGRAGDPGGKRRPLLALEEKLAAPALASLQLSHDLGSLLRCARRGDDLKDISSQYL